MSQPSRQVQNRAMAIDRLRTAMMCIVMFGHAMLPYLTTPRRFKDPATSIWFDWIGIFLYGFAMPAFFVTAGFAGAALFSKRGSNAFWKHRWQRLGIPLLAGYVLLTPLTRAAYEFAQVTALNDSIAAGWAQLMKGDWLRWSKLYHLWFLASLILFSGLWLAIRSVYLRLPASMTHRLSTVFGRVMQSGSAALVFGLITGAPMALSYISGTGQGTDGWMQTALLMYFGLGWCLYGTRDALQAQAQHWPIATVGAFVITPLCAWSTQIRLFAEGTSDIPMGLVAGFSNGLLGAFATIALLGIAQRWMERQSEVADYLSAASYWIYLVHYPIVVAAGGIVSVIDSTAVIKYLLSVGIAVPMIFLSFEILRRSRNRPRTD